MLTIIGLFVALIAIPFVVPFLYSPAAFVADWKALGPWEALKIAWRDMLCI